MSFNPIERKIAQLLSASPKLKSILKYSYQWMNRRFYRKSYAHFSSSYIADIGSETKESFLGYYDHSPLNESNRFIFFHEAEIATSLAPKANSQVQIVVSEFETEKEIFRTSSKAYNWQQGSKMMWLDEERFIFNDFRNGDLVSRILSVSDLAKEVEIPYPIYDCKSDFALTLNFDRLTHFRPDYGYRSANQTIDVSSFSDELDGVFHIDFITKKRTLIISLKDLKIISKADVEGHNHWVNHIMISPNAKRMMFLHRWIENGVKKDALYVADIDGENLECVINEGMVSHCFWKNDQEIIGYLSSEKFGNTYHHIHLSSGEIDKIEIPDEEHFGDGHPSTFNHQILFDTYPDRSGMKHLQIFNEKTLELKELGAFYEPLKYYEESRCDLHPRFSMDGKRVFFDSVHSGKRRLSYINLEEAK